MAKQTLSEKILARSSGRSRVSAGEIITAQVNRAMMDDILGPKVVDKPFSELNMPIWNTDRVVIICDHYAPSGTINQADIVAYTRKWAREHGIEHYFEGEGPCHQILAEKGFSLPNTLLLGTDSHTCTAGAFGCFGTGIGSTEMAGVLATGSTWLRVPESIRITWNGTLQKGVMAKDIILKVIGDIGHAGATYMVLEFGGGTISGLSMDERMCICNMAIEAGAKAGLIPADEKTVQYLSDHGVAWNGTFLQPDEDAEYVQIKNYTGEDLEPQIALPHNVDNVVGISEAPRQAVQRAYIGSCTGGRLSDLASAANILRGRKVCKDIKLLVSPASQRIWKEAASLGILQDLAEAGATILAPTCGACLGVHSGLVGEGEHCISSTNRNFKGRMGSKNSFVYLASPMSVAASALEGRLADPRDYL